MTRATCHFYDNDYLQGGNDDGKAAAADDDGVDVCDFDNDDDEDDDIVYLLQGSVHKFGLHASVDAPLVPDEAQSSICFLSPFSLFDSFFKCINDEKDFFEQCPQKFDKS